MSGKEEEPTTSQDELERWLLAATGQMGYIAQLIMEKTTAIDDKEEKERIEEALADAITDFAELTANLENSFRTVTQEGFEKDQ